MATKACTEGVKTCCRAYRTTYDPLFHNDPLAIFQIVFQPGMPKEKMAAVIVTASTTEVRFSKRAPQQATYLLAANVMLPPSEKSFGISASFAVGGDKTEGNVKLTATRSTAQAAEKSPSGDWISGNCADVGLKAKAFAGRTIFQDEAVYEKSARLVRGIVYFAKTGARITLSGGVQG